MAKAGTPAKAHYPVANLDEPRFAACGSGFRLSTLGISKGGLPGVWVASVGTSPGTTGQTTWSQRRGATWWLRAAG